MASDKQIDELLLRWEAARQEGDAPSVDELCADCPELIEEVRERIAAVEAMEQRLGMNEPDLGETLPAEEAPPDEKDRAEQDRASAPLPEIPGYEVLEMLEEGGMGVVYRARQIELDRTVAIKMMSRGLAGTKFVARFRTEAEAVARLQHPNVVQIFEIGEADGRPFFSMEYVDGGNLARHIADDPPSPRKAAELVETLARAMHAAHERGIVHRDLKPSNVILTSDGVPKITDFGIAKRLDDSSGHTQTGELLGTPSYMAPEQAGGRREEIGPLTDVYALGVILYEMLTGKPPFRGTDAMDSIRRLSVEEPTPISRVLPTVSRDLEAICLKCLEKSPAARYASAADFADDLRRFLDGQAIVARRIGPLRRAWRWAKRHPAISVAAAAVLMVAAAIPIVLEIRHYREQQRTRLLAEQEARRIRERAVQVAPQVREILHRNCYACHGETPEDIEKDLDVLDHVRLLDSKRKIVVPGAPDDSRLIQRIADGSMPPEEQEIELPRITELELSILRDWILGGAPPLPPEDPEDPTPPVVPYSALAAEVKQIFVKRCYKCHKHNVARGGIKILHHRLLTTVRKVVVPGQPEESELLHLITTGDGKLVMPPRPAVRLSAEEVETIRRWIQEGAPSFPKG